MDELGRRLALVEAKQVETGVNQRYILDGFLELKKDIKELTAAVQGLAISLASRKECPSPGHCLELSRDLAAIAAERERHALAIASLERQLERVRGGLWLAGKIAAGAALALAVAKYFYP